MSKAIRGGIPLQATSRHSGRRQQTVLRLAAALLVAFLLIITSYGGIQLMQQVSPTAQVAAHHPKHTDGIIVRVTVDKSFTLQTPTGTLLHFLCGSSCHASLWHMQRHIQEKAHTDVFYQETRNHQLQALYVD